MQQQADPNLMNETVTYCPWRETFGTTDANLNASSVNVSIVPDNATETVGPDDTSSPPNTLLPVPAPAPTIQTLVERKESDEAKCGSSLLVNKESGGSANDCISLRNGDGRKRNRKKLRGV